MASMAPRLVDPHFSLQEQWLHSYVTDDRIYWVYQASAEDAEREHARRGGFPADRIVQVRAVIDPASAE